MTNWPGALQILDARFLTLSGLGSTYVQFPNTSNDLPPTALHYRIEIIPTGNEPELWGGDHEKGIYQVTVLVPAQDGSQSAMTAAQAVIDHFKRQNLSGVSCGVPALGKPMQLPNWWQVPVSIPFIVL